jgi:hypothetical protein
LLFDLLIYFCLDCFCSSPASPWLFAPPQRTTAAGAGGAPRPHRGAISRRLAERPAACRLQSAGHLLARRVLSVLANQSKSKWERARKKQGNKKQQNKYKTKSKNGFHATTF